MLFRKHAGRRNSQADCFTMEKPAISSSSFDAVPDGVAEVQKSADAFGFKLVVLDNRGFDSRIAGDESFEIALGYEQLQHFRIADGCMFDDFGEPLVELPGRQSG